MDALKAKFKTLLTKGWKSKTVLLGYLTMALGAVQEALAQFQVVLSAHTYAVLGAVLGALIVAVRLATKISLDQK